MSHNNDVSFVLELKAKAHSFQTLQAYLLEAAKAIEHQGKSSKEGSQHLPVTGLHVNMAFGSRYEYSIDRDGRVTLKEVAKAIGLLLVAFFAILGVIKVFPPK